MTTNELSKMTDPELLALNQRIVAELSHRSANKQIAAASRFRVGQFVTFFSRRHGRVTIRISRINTKSLSGMTDTGTTWKVSPSLCEPVKA